MSESEFGDDKSGCEVGGMFTAFKIDACAGFAAIPVPFGTTGNARSRLFANSRAPSALRAPRFFAC